MGKGECRFSPLAEAQLDILWDYGYQRFGLPQADKYLDGLFTAINEVAISGRYRGLVPRQVPAGEIADITVLPIQYIHYEKHYLYLRELPEERVGVVCILGDRMDTPQRLREDLFSSELEMIK